MSFFMLFDETTEKNGCFRFLKTLASARISMPYRAIARKRIRNVCRSYVSKPNLGVFFSFTLFACRSDKNVPEILCGCSYYNF